MVARSVRHNCLIVLLATVFGLAFSMPFASLSTFAAVKTPTAKAPAVSTPAKPGVAKAVATPAEGKAVTATEAKKVSPLDLVQSPEQYLNQTVVLDGTFNSFATLGLDYKKAYRDGNKYLSVVILRPDVTTRSIPLSELKLFVARKNSEPLMDLETGDSVRITGTVFSSALGDPWVDINTLTVTHKAHPDKAKEKS